jgi:hypothetical protein
MAQSLRAFTAEHFASISDHNVVYRRESQLNHHIFCTQLRIDKELLGLQDYIASGLFAVLKCFILGQSILSRCEGLS